MVPRVYHFLLVKETMQLVEVCCTRCGRRRVLPRRVKLAKVVCVRCGHEIVPRRIVVG